MTQRLRGIGRRETGSRHERSGRSQQDTNGGKGSITARGVIDEIEGRRMLARRPDRREGRSRPALALHQPLRSGPPDRNDRGVVNGGGPMIEGGVGYCRSRWQHRTPSWRVAVD